MQLDKGWSKEFLYTKGFFMNVWGGGGGKGAWPPTVPR